MGYEREHKPEMAGAKPAESLTESAASIQRSIQALHEKFPASKPWPMPAELQEEIEADAKRHAEINAMMSLDPDLLPQLDGETLETRAAVATAIATGRSANLLAATRGAIVRLEAISIRARRSSDDVAIAAQKAEAAIRELRSLLEVQYGALVRLERRLELVALLLIGGIIVLGVLAL